MVSRLWLKGNNLKAGDLKDTKVFFSVLISFLTGVDSGEGGDLERGLRSNLDGLDLERGLVEDLDLEVEGLGLDLDLDRGLSGDFESFEDFEL